MRWKNRNPELQLQAKEQKCLFLTVFNCFRKPTSQHRNSCYLPTVCRALKTTHKVNETLAQGAVRSRLQTPTAVLEQEPSHALPSGQRDTRGDTRTAPASGSAPTPARSGPSPGAGEAAAAHDSRNETTEGAAGPWAAERRSPGPRCADAGHTRQERPQAAERLGRHRLHAEPRGSDLGQGLDSREPFDRAHVPVRPGRPRETAPAGSRHLTQCYGPRRPPCFTEARVARARRPRRSRESRSDSHSRSGSKGSASGDIAISLAWMGCDVIKRRGEPERGVATWNWSETTRGWRCPGREKLAFRVTTAGENGIGTRAAPQAGSDHDPP